MDAMMMAQFAALQEIMMLWQANKSNQLKLGIATECTSSFYKGVYIYGV